MGSPAHPRLSCEATKQIALLRFDEYQCVLEAIALSEVDGLKMERRGGRREGGWRWGRGERGGGEERVPVKVMAVFPILV